MKKLLLVFILSLANCQYALSALNVVGGVYHEYKEVKRHDKTMARFDFLEADMKALRDVADKKQDKLPLKETGAGVAIATALAASWIYRGKLKDVLNNIPFYRVKDFFGGLKDKIKGIKLPDMKWRD